VPDQIATLEYRAVTGRARAVVDRLGSAVIQPPPSGGWSVGDCLEHLNVTTRIYLPLQSAQ
jgi:hypothetical protein